MNPTVINAKPPATAKTTFVVELVIGCEKEVVPLDMLEFAFPTKEDWKPFEGVTTTSFNSVVASVMVTFLPTKSFAKTVIGS